MKAFQVKVNGKMLDYRLGEKLKPVLASRAIGGFLDEALKREPNYQMAVSFQEFVEAL